jgi:hypothetical protein
MKHRRNRHSNPEQDAPQNLPEVINFNYDGNPVSFTVNGKVMVNATEMAKTYGKRPVDWLRLPSTTDFIEELTKVRNSHFDNFIKPQAGGKNPGTWMHEDVALEFARWLNPRFAIWCNDRIKELVQGRQPSAIDPAAFGTLITSLQSFTDATKQSFEKMNQRMNAFENRVEQRLSAVESRKELSTGGTREAPVHDQMDLRLVNFNIPAYLHKKMKTYCVMKNMTMGEYLNNLIVADIIN